MARKGTGRLLLLDGSKVRLQVRHSQLQRLQHLKIPEQQITLLWLSWRVRISLRLGNCLRHMNAAVPQVS
jgi:hypothetical protein